MTLTRDEKTFLLVLAGSTLLSLLYLVWFLIFSKKKDNRIRCCFHAVTMLLCPVVGPCFFFLSWLLRHLLPTPTRDLSDVEFSKKRHESRLKADLQRERNIVPVGESILISDRENLRRNMLNILMGNSKDSLSAISLALDHDDSEVAHYAASFLQSRLDSFRQQVRSEKELIHQRKQAGEPYYEEMRSLLFLLQEILKQRVLSKPEQEELETQLIQMCSVLYEADKSFLEPGLYETVFQLLYEKKDFSGAELWSERFLESHPAQIAPWQQRLKLFFETGQQQAFLQTLSQLRGSSVEVDHQTLELIRLFDCAEGKPL